MKKNIDLLFEGIAPEKVIYDIDNHSLVVLYPEQKEFKKGDKVRLKKNLNLEIGKWYNDVVYCKRIDDVKDAILTIDKVSESSGNIKAYNNIDGDWWMYSSEWLEHATENEVEFKSGEQRELFDALKKEGKKWNAETLEIEEVVPEFKKGDILASDNKTLLIFDEYITYNKEKDSFYSLWNNKGISNINWQTKYFKHATDEQIAQLHEDLRRNGEKWNAETLEVEDLDISEIAVDLESACEYLKKPIPNFSSLFCSLSLEDYHKYSAQITLQLIREAWNKFDGFEVDWENRNQLKYVLMFKVKDGNIEFSYTSFTMEVLDFHTSNFSFKTEERARQFGKQFIDLIKIAL